MARVEFRDGHRFVPDHVEVMLRGIDTYQLTFDEAIAEANRRALNNHVDQAFSKIRKAHFDGLRNR